MTATRNSFELYVPAATIARALRAVSERGAVEPAVVLEGGALSAGARMLLRAGHPLHLSLALHFAPDAAFEAYIARGHGRITGQPPCVTLHMSLALQVGRIYGQLTFTATTSPMSFLFETSPSVRDTFVSMARQTAAICLLLRRSDGPCRVVDRALEIAPTPPGDRAPADRQIAELLANMSHGT